MACHEPWLIDMPIADCATATHWRPGGLETIANWYYISRRPLAAASANFNYNNQRKIQLDDYGEETM